MITGIVAPEPKPSIEPQLSIEYETSPEASEFLTQYHLFGPADGFLSILARHNDSIVGAWVFSQDRDEPCVAVLDRACFSYEYEPGDAHQRALDMALPLLKERGYTKLLAFADNRFDTGELYEKLGFEFEGSVAPAPMYVRSGNRKSMKELGISSGDEPVVKVKSKKWYRIWDSGKKRYRLPI